MRFTLVSPIQLKLCAITLAVVAGLAACSNNETEQAAVTPAVAPTQSAAGGSAETNIALDNAGQWLSYGRNYSEQRFSPLDQINPDNIGELNLAWFGDLAERGGSYETTPLVIDGRIYVCTPWSKVYAFDAKTGAQLWKYDPKVPGEWEVNL